MNHATRRKDHLHRREDASPASRSAAKGGERPTVFLHYWGVITRPDDADLNEGFPQQPSKILSVSARGVKLGQNRMLGSELMDKPCGDGPQRVSPVAVEIREILKGENPNPLR
jgi:hypothetical protein